MLNILYNKIKKMLGFFGAILAGETPKWASGWLPYAMSVTENSASGECYVIMHPCWYFCEILATVLEGLMIKGKQVHKEACEGADLFHWKYSSVRFKGQIQNQTG